MRSLPMTSTDRAPSAGLFSEPPAPTQSATPSQRAVTTPFGAPPVPDEDGPDGPAEAADAAADRHAPGNPAWSSPSTDATGHADGDDSRARRRGGPPASRRTNR